jgi:hypothetical protein
MTKYPERVASYFVKNLVHETLKEQKFAITIMNMMLRQNRREHQKILLDSLVSNDHRLAMVENLKLGMREDIRWLQYDVAEVPHIGEGMGLTEIYVQGKLVLWMSQ